MQLRFGSDTELGSARSTRMGVVDMVEAHARSQMGGSKQTHRACRTVAGFVEPFLQLASMQFRFGSDTELGSARWTRMGVVEAHARSQMGGLKQTHRACRPVAALDGPYRTFSPVSKHAGSVRFGY